MIPPELGAELRWTTYASSGEPRALQSLARQLLPVLRAEARRLHHRPGFAPDVDDLVQTGFEQLFEKDCLALRRWDPGRGLSFFGYIRFVARRRMLSALRRSARARETPLTEEALRRWVRDERIEARAHARAELERIVPSLERRLSERARAVFIALYVDGCDTSAAAQSLSLTEDAVRSHHKRIRKLAADIQSRRKKKNVRSRPVPA